MKHNNNKNSHVKNIIGLAFSIITSFLIGYYGSDLPFSSEISEFSEPFTSSPSWLDKSVGFLFFAAIGLYFVGLCLPKYHSFTSTETYPAPIDLVWSVITDFESKADWHDLIEKVEKIKDSPEVWRIHDVHGDHLDYRTVLLQTPYAVRYEVDTYCDEDSDTPFLKGGETYRLREQDGQTVVTMTTEAVETNPFLRIISRFRGYLKTAQTVAHRRYVRRISDLKV